MNLADLDSKSAEMERLRLTWEGRLLPEVRARVHEVRLHASYALTEANTGGGPNLPRLRSSPAFSTATRRLDDLANWLTGRQDEPLHGAVRDARDSFYRRAAELHLPTVPDEYRSRSVPEPPQHRVDAVRAAAIHGYDPRAVVLPQLDGAKATLAIHLGRAALSGLDPAQHLDHWERTTAASLMSLVRTLLNDSVEYADALAGRDLIHPDAIDDSAVEDASDGSG